MRSKKIRNKAAAMKPEVTITAETANFFRLKYVAAKPKINDTPTQILVCADPSTVSAEAENLITVATTVTIINTIKSVFELFPIFLFILFLKLVLFKNIDFKG